MRMGTGSRVFIAIALLSTPLLAGCTAPEQQTQRATDTEPSTQYLADRERAEMQAYEVYWNAFELYRTAEVSFETETRNSQTYDVCLTDETEREFWTNGEATRCYEKGESVRHYSDSATLSAGEYILGLRCPHETPCTVSYSLWVR